MVKVLQSGDVTQAESLMTVHVGHTRGLWVGRSEDETRSG
jgi:hypothetical protein